MNLWFGAGARVAEQIQSLGSNLIIVLSGSITAGGVRLGSGSQLTVTEEVAAVVRREIASVQVVAPAVGVRAGGCGRRHQGGPSSVRRSGKRSLAARIPWAR